MKGEGASSAHPFHVGAKYASGQLAAAHDNERAQHRRGAASGLGSDCHVGRGPATRESVRMRRAAVSLSVAAVVLGAAGPLKTASAANTPEVGGARAHFSMCFTGAGYNCVVDGDTIWLQGTKIRIADIDAPETHDPRCPSEKALGDRASVRLQQLLNRGVVSLETVARDRDRYGRALRIVNVNGNSVGDVLVSEGLAREWDGARHPWC